jgi:hypothetical protein
MPPRRIQPGMGVKKRREKKARPPQKVRVW